MKRFLIILFGALALMALYAVTARNGLVALDEGVNEKWAQVENVYQRRVDLIPNLVNTVKGYAAHEKTTLEDVIKARAAAVNPQAAMTTGAPHSDEEMRAFENSQNALTGTLSRLMVVVEKYPDLKANENFLALQSQLEGTENRITVERQRYNEIVREYNTKIRSFPTNVVAGFFTFERRALFTAKPGSDVVPEVKF
jgi:LemA protein